MADWIGVDMGKVPAFGRDATRVSPLNYERILNPRCIWRGDDSRYGERCNEPCEEGVPVCWHHGFVICMRMSHLTRERGQQSPDDVVERPDDETLDAQAAATEPQTRSFVYYLMLSPTTVKIGTTRNLPQRITAHRSELQYVVALEQGGRDVEKARHEQFPMERHGAAEIFTLSDALKRHIETLVPQRDELMKLATC